jgi:hypothetical protein
MNSFCSPVVRHHGGSGSFLSQSQSSPPPPMESLSTYSSTTDDDNTSVSSVSTQGSVVVTRRSVFSQYWKNTGQEPPKFLARSRTPAPTEPSGTSSADSSVDATEDAVVVDNDDTDEVDTPKTSGSAKALPLSTPPEHEEVLESEVPSMAAAAVAVASPSDRQVRHRRFQALPAVVMMMMMMIHLHRRQWVSSLAHSPC